MNFGIGEALYALHQYLKIGRFSGDTTVNCYRYFVRSSLRVDRHGNGFDFRAVGIVNFAQGDFLMLGAFICFAFNQKMGMPIWLSFTITAVLIGLSGIVFQFITYWPLRDAQDKTIIVSTLGAS